MTPDTTDHSEDKSQKHKKILGNYSENTSDEMGDIFFVLGLPSGGSFATSCWMALDHDFTRALADINSYARAELVDKGESGGFDGDAQWKLVRPMLLHINTSGYLFPVTSADDWEQYRSDPDRVKRRFALLDRSLSDSKLLESFESKLQQTFPTETVPKLKF